MAIYPGYNTPNNLIAEYDDCFLYSSLIKKINKHKTNIKIKKQKAKLIHFSYLKLSIKIQVSGFCIKMHFKSKSLQYATGKSMLAHHRCSIINQIKIACSSSYSHR